MSKQPTPEAVETPIEEMLRAVPEGWRTYSEDPDDPMAGSFLHGSLLRDAADLITELRAQMCHHGWRGGKPGGEEVVRTPCPACGGQLFIGDDGHLTCAVLKCSHDPSIEVWWKEQAAVITELRAEVERLKEEVQQLRSLRRTGRIA